MQKKHTHTNNNINHVCMCYICVWICNNVFTIQRLFDRFITPCIDYIIDGLNNMRKQNPLKRVIHQTNLNMVTQFCCMFDAMFPTLKSSSNNTTTAASVLPRTTSSSMATMRTTTSMSIDDDDAIIECGFIDVKIHNILLFFSHFCSILRFCFCTNSMVLFHSYATAYTSTCGVVRRQNISAVLCHPSLHRIEQSFWCHNRCTHVVWMYMLYQILCTLFESNLFIFRVEWKRSIAKTDECILVFVQFTVTYLTYSNIT